MSTPAFDIPYILYSVRSHKKLVITITLIAAIIGGLFYCLSPAKYEAKAEFILLNPVYSDRSNIYNGDGKYIDYFASEDDINRAVSMASSSVVLCKVISNMKLTGLYGVDSTLPGAATRLQEKVDRRLNVIRTENRDIKLSYVDTDPVRAAAVAGNFIEVLGETYGGYYKEMRMNIHQTVIDKIHYEDSAIAKLTDSLTALRQQYGIYDIISPTRHNMMETVTDKARTENFARGLELIQNVEAVKDEMVSDRAVSVTLANQYASGQKKSELPMIKLITPATPPNHRAGGSIIVMVAASAFVGFLFCIVLVLLIDSFAVSKKN